MRLSILPGDKGYASDEERRRIIAIELNGVLLEPKNVMFADEEEGQVLILVRGDDGEKVRDPRDPKSLLTELKDGRVKIHMKPKLSVVDVRRFKHIGDVPGLLN